MLAQKNTPLPPPSTNRRINRPPGQCPQIALRQINTITTPVTAPLPHRIKRGLARAVVELAMRVCAGHVVIAPLRARETRDLDLGAGEIDLGRRVGVVAQPRAFHEQVARGPLEDGGEVPGLGWVGDLVEGVGDVHAAAGVEPEVAADALGG